MLGRRRVVAAALVAAVVLTPPDVWSQPASAVSSIAGVRFERVVSPFVVTRADGSPYALPFLGGLDVPRPQFTDIDGDGDMDLFLQEYSNSLWFFENTGSGGAPRFEWRTDRFLEIDTAEWFRFIDLDNDGLFDLLSESPVSRIRHYRNTGTKKAPAFTLVGELRDGTGAPMFMDRQNIPALADIDCDGRLDMLVGRVEGVVDRYEATAPGVAQFSLIAERYEGIEIIGGIGMPTTRHGANALALGDFDADGDQDLFWGDFFEPAILLIENVGSTCSNPSFQSEPVTLPFAAGTRTSGYNAPAPVDMDGDGDLDFFLGVIGGAFNPIRTGEDNFYFWERTAAKAFTLRTRRFLDGIDHGSDAAPAFADIDADGDLDLIVGSKIDAQTGSYPSLQVYRNDGTRTAPRFRAMDPVRLVDAYNFTPAAGDLDADGDIDLIVGTWNQDLVFVRNEGTPQVPRWVPDPAGAIKPPRASHLAPALGDLDNDGDLDLIAGQANGMLLYYRNTGSRRAPKFTLVTDKLDDLKVGRRSTPTLIDVDGDGLLDLVIGHEDRGPLMVARNAGTRTSPKFVMAEPLPMPFPPISAPAFADIDGDGVQDLLVGTTSGGMRFYRGSRGLVRSAPSGATEQQRQGLQLRDSEGDDRIPVTPGVGVDSRL